MSKELSGGNVNYYLAEIKAPKRLAPYTAECEDIIEALGMTFAEGCAFKAIWRKCAERTLGLSKEGYGGQLYDAQKAQHYGSRMVATEERLAAAAKPVEAVRVDPFHAMTPGFLEYPDITDPAFPTEQRISNIVNSHGDGEHYGEVRPRIESA